VGFDQGISRTAVRHAVTSPLRPERIDEADTKAVLQSDVAWQVYLWAYMCVCERFVCLCYQNSNKMVQCIVAR